MSEVEVTSSKAKAKEVTDTTDQRGLRQYLTGVVVSDKMDKTRVISVRRMIRDRLYHKASHEQHKFFIHDEKNTSRTGDTVEAVSCRPLSRHKSFRLVKVIQKRAEV